MMSSLFFDPIFQTLFTSFGWLDSIGTSLWHSPWAAGQGLNMMPLLAEVDEAEIGSFVIAGVLLSLITVFIAAKVGGELCARLNLPSVLGKKI